MRRAPVDARKTEARSVAAPASICSPAFVQCSPRLERSKGGPPARQVAGGDNALRDAAGRVADDGSVATGGGRRTARGARVDGDPGWAAPSSRADRRRSRSRSACLRAPGDLPGRCSLPRTPRAGPPGVSCRRDRPRRRRRAGREAAPPRRGARPLSGPTEGRGRGARGAGRVGSPPARRCARPGPTRPPPHRDGPEAARFVTAPAPVSPSQRALRLEGRERTRRTSSAWRWVSVFS